MYNMYFLLVIVENWVYRSESMTAHTSLKYKTIEISCSIGILDYLLKHRRSGSCAATFDS